MSLLVFASLAAAVATPNTEAFALQQAHAFGACAVQQSPGEAARLLAMDFRADDYWNALRTFASSHKQCLLPGNRLAAGGVIYAGAIAEALLAKQVPAAAVAQQLAYDPARAPIPARSETEVMALCTVMQAPQATSEVLAAGPATAEEHQAMTRVAAVLPKCLKKDMNLTLTPPALRALLALAALRVVEAPKGPVQ